jgi:hypothetical protein
MLTLKVETDNNFVPACTTRQNCTIFAKVNSPPVLLYKLKFPELTGKGTFWTSRTRIRIN